MAENKTPTLYKLYDKEYSYDDLQRQADLGLNDYIMRLRRGEKDEQRFKDAYYNLMSGIKDGTITFDNGKYHDSKGRYFNGVYYDEEGNKQTSKKKTKDYYGLMANYIYNTQRGINEYTKPEDPTKIKWNGSKSVGLALTRNIFNSDTFDYRTYLDSDVDSYDESTNKIGTKNRVASLRSALENTLNNFDNVFTGYTDDDKAKAVQYIQEAIKSLDDGISPTDYLPLKRAAGELDYRKMFIDTYKPKQEVEQKQQEEQQEQEAQQQQQLSPKQAFQQQAEANHPMISRELKIFQATKVGGIGGQGKPYGNYTNQQIRSILEGLSDSELQRILDDTLYGKGFSFNNYLYGKKKLNYHISNSTGIYYLVSEIKRRNMLKEHNGEYYYTLPSAKYTSLKITKDGKIHEINQWDNPFLAQQFINEYKRSNGGAYSDIYTTYIAKQKNGGILKFQSGGQTPMTQKERDEIRNFMLYGTTPNYFKSAIEAISYTDDDLANDKRIRNIYNNGQYTFGLREDVASTDKTETGNGRYDPEGPKGGDDKLQAQKYYNPWVNILTSNKKVAEKWARRYNELNTTSGTDYRQGWFNSDDTFNFESFKNSKNLWEDKINGVGHDFYRGRAYRIKDTDEYYQEIPDGYDVVPGDPKVDDTGLVNVYELVKKDQSTNQGKNPTDQTSDDKTKGTDTTPTTENPLNRPKIPSILFEDLIETGRLFNSLRTNKKIYDTLRPSLKPTLRDTYELYSPITGAFSEMQLRNRQGADMQRKAEMPFTSDATLQLAGQLDANKQANELQYQGFIADDREIKRTSAEALKRQEDNKARRSEVANINRERINQVNRELAQLKAGKLQQDYTGVDNFMQYLKNRITTENERKRTFNLQSETTNIDNQYQDALYEMQERINKWRAQNPDKDITTMEGYTDYLKARRNLDSWRRAKYQEAYGNVYGYRYDSPYNYKTAWEIANGLKIAKKGGVLIPKIIK